MKHDKTVLSLLFNLKKMGCQIWLENGKLKIRTGKEGIPDSLKDELKQQKAAIIDFLAQANAQEPSGEKIPKQLPDAPLAISFAQQRLWFLNQFEGSNSATYNIPAALRLVGKLNRAALENSLHWLLERHHSLRTCFPSVNGQAQVQVLALDPINVLTLHDLTQLSPEAQTVEVQNSANQHAIAPFDLANGPLFKADLLQLSNDQAVLLLNMHHIISDGWSMGIFIRDWQHAYTAFAQGKSPQIAPLEIQYQDYAAWQKNWLQGDVLERQLAYWTTKLADAPELLEIPTDYSRPSRMSHQGKNLQTTLSAELTQGVKQLSQQQGVTVFMTLLAAFKVLLYRYSGQTDLVVGSPIANRTHYQTEDLIGFFVNTLVLRTQMNETDSFLKLLEQVKHTALDAYNHQDIPFEYLVERINPTRSTSHSPLFQVVFSLQNTPAETLELNDLKVAFLQQTLTTVKFDLVLTVTEQGEVLLCDWKYNTDIFRPETLVRMSEHFQVLLTGILNHLEQPLFQLPLLTETEQQQLLDWNQINTDYATHKTIAGLFQAQVEKTPAHVAVVFEGQALSYETLNKKANQLAHYLMHLPVEAGTLVGICVERSLEMVIGLLGILKAGGAYVPLDPYYPQERLQDMLEDSGTPILLTQSHLLEQLPVTQATAIQVICLDSEWEPIATYSQANPPEQSQPEDLAYIIYTSGSTGRPKGCQVTQANVTRLFAATAAWYHFNHQDVWTLFHSYAFDFSVWEIWGALLYGGKLVVVPFLTSRNPEAFYQLLIEQQVTILNQTPSAFKQLINVDTQPDELRLRCVIFGGEALDFAALKSWYARHQDNSPQLINMYGITETTVHVTYYPLSSDVDASSRVIGRPIPDLQVWILDTYHQPVPIGGLGEMYVGGAGVTRGYLNRPELTAERFIEMEVLGKPQRLYKTGDLARLTLDPHTHEYHLEYLGRIDHQVKLRGFRIELGEIETLLRQHEAVSEAIVMLHGQADTLQLIAYVTLNTSIDEVDRILRSWLKTRLPEYMLPASFTVLAQLPLTPSGKIDRKALPEPHAIRTGFVAPQTAAEHLIANIWQELLDIEQIGVHDDFFAIGGNSLNGIRFINQLNYKTGEVFHIYALFEASTVALFVDYIKDHYPKLMAQLEGSALPTDTVKHQPLTPAKQAEIRQLLPKLSFNNTKYNQKNPPAVFILAPPRSGTTLFRVMLGGHPQLFAPPELELLGFNSLEERYTQCMQRDSFWLQGTIRALMEIAHCDVDTAQQQMHRYEQEKHDIKGFYQVLQTAIGDRLLVDKTPFYAIDINILRQAEAYFDDALYIHLLRHPYGMIHSFEKAHLEQIISSHPYAYALDNGYSPTELAEFLWLQCNQNILDFLQTVPASRQHTVKFEALVAHPHATIEKLCEFLPITFDATMLQPYQDNKQRMTDGLHAEGNMLGDIKFHTHQHINASVAEEWKNTYRKDFLGDITWKLAEQLGYQRELNLMDIPTLSEDQPLTLSFAQQRLWFIAQLEEQTATYNIPAVVRLTGSLNKTALEKTLRALIERHESLRVYFPAVNGKATIKRGTIDNPLGCTDFSALAKTEQQGQVTEWIAKQVQTPFDLNTGPLLKLHLLKLAEEEHILLFNMHHIISDGWSMSLLIREWSHLYNAYTQNQAPQLPGLTIQYTDYAAWQKNWLADKVLAQQLAYWTEKLAGAPDCLDLPTDYPRPAVMHYQGQHLQSTLSPDLTAPLKQFSQQHGVTVFMTLLTAFKVLLCRYTGQTDLLVGTPVANRTHHQTDDLIGFFVNTLVLRTQINKQHTCLQLLEQVKQTALEAYHHQDVPFEHLVEKLNPPRSLSYSPLFQVMFVFQNVPVATVELNGLKVSFLEPESPTAKFDLSLNIAEREGIFVCYWEYKTSLFSSDTITRMSQHFHTLLAGILNHPKQIIFQLPLLTEAEQQQLLRWNQTETQYPKGQTLVDVFQTQVDKTPDNIAVVFEDQQLNYQQLNEQANQLAHHLIQLKQQAKLPDNPLIAIAVERSLAMVIGLLGILKAGGAYVPIDPHYPPSRIEHMLTDSGVPIVLTQSVLKALLPLETLTQACEVICLDEMPFYSYPRNNPTVKRNVNDLAYMIYTSGSTGAPKGTVITQVGFSNLLAWYQQALQLSDNDTTLICSAFGFDLTQKNLITPLLIGAKISLPTDYEPIQLIQLIKEHRVTWINCAPSAFYPLLEIDQNTQWQHLSSLRWVVLGGEPIQLPRLNHWLSSTQCQLMNSYGPTECTDVTAAYTYQAQDSCMPIGRPIGNTRVYILNAQHQPQPPNIPGELCIAGAGLAPGYLNRPELTAEKFIEVDLLGKRERIYQTGDLARWLPNGHLEYLRRIDHQVKLRGFRIEMGEIEAVLSQHASVKEAVVVLYEMDDNKQLVAYITVTLESNELVRLLKTHLQAHLPDYMIPSHITILDKLPLTPNGKIDRKALPAPEAQAHHDSALPRNALELKLLGIWESVLNVQPLGIHDNFFDLGGHSLLAVRLMSHIQQQCGMRLPVSALFQSATIAALAQQLTDDTAALSNNLVAMQTTGQGHPLYCLPGAVGSVMYLYPLAAYLGHPFYALQTPGLDGAPTPTTVTALAHDHLQALQQQQPTGPYYLIGHSSGGRVAFEMALQLEQQGETIAFLGILDNRAPDAEPQEVLTARTELAWLAEIVVVFQELTGTELNCPLATLQTLPDLETAYTHVMQVFIKQEILFAPNAPMAELKALVNTYRITTQAHSAYQTTGKLCCPIHLFRAQAKTLGREGVEFEDPRPTWGWAAHTQAEVIEQFIPGTHVTMVASPHVQTLAAAINTYL